jgi:hypothetical protein
MKSLIVAIALFTTPFITTAQEITADQIIDNYAENTGGRDAWSKVEGYSMTGNVVAQGMTLPFEQIELKNGMKMTKISFQGMEMIQDAYDGETVWNQTYPSMLPEKAEAETTENHKREIGSFPNPLFDYKTLGYTVELQGEETKEGVECYKLKMTKKTQLVEGEEVENIEYYYFDKENFVPIAIEQQILAGPMKGEMSTIVFSDYQEIDGLYFPFSLTDQSGGGNYVINIETVVLNPKMDPAAFGFPAE